MAGWAASSRSPRPLGVVGGTGIASATGSIAAGYLTTAAVLVVLAIPYCLDARDHAAAAAPA